MKPWMVTALLVMVALAGCASDDGSQDETSDDTDFTDKGVQASDDTGVILGVVVDDTINAVPDATVTLTSTVEPVETTTDEQGRFVFDDLDPGAHFLTVSKALHEKVQTSVDVIAGVSDPDILKVQLPRLFQGEPYIQAIPKEGFFECSQAKMPGYFYSSSSCHDNGLGSYAGAVTGQPVPSTDLSDQGVTLEQERTFHFDVSNGWQDAVFEMTWEASAQGTSERMGMVVSTEKETRDGRHWFANVESTSPMYFVLQPNATHETAGDVEPRAIPAEGFERISYFMSVRPQEGAVCPLDFWCAPPGIALDQSFSSFVHVFYYATAPEGWSIVNGDEPPF